MRDYCQYLCVKEINNSVHNLEKINKFFIEYNAYLFGRRRQKNNYLFPVAVHLLCLVNTKYAILVVVRFLLHSLKIVTFLIINLKHSGNINR